MKRAEFLSHVLVYGCIPLNSYYAVFFAECDPKPMKRTGLLMIFCVAVISAAGNCTAQESIARRSTGPAAVYTAVVVRTYPHDPEAFTQGLVYLNGTFFEGTGLYGKSTLRRIDPATGTVAQRVSLEGRYFGEGITVFNDKVIQLTWKARIGFVYDRSSFSLLRTFWYPTEGWGLTHDETHLIMSDGTDTLFFIDPVTYTTVRTLNVSERGRKIHHLNELEYVNGEIFAMYGSRIVLPESARIAAKLPAGYLWTVFFQATNGIKMCKCLMASLTMKFATGSLLA